MFTATRKSVNDDHLVSKHFQSLCAFIIVSLCQLPEEGPSSYTSRVCSNRYPAGPVSGQNRFLNVTLPPLRNRTNHTVFINLLWTQLWVQHTDEDLSETSTVAKIWYVSACFTVIECLHTDCSTIFSLFLVVSQFLQVVRIVDQVTSLQDMPFPPYSTVPYPIPLQTLSGHQISFSRLDTFAFSHCGFTH